MPDSVQVTTVPAEVMATETSFLVLPLPESTRVVEPSCVPELLYHSMLTWLPERATRAMLPLLSIATLEYICGSPEKISSVKLLKTLVTPCDTPDALKRCM